MSIDLKANNLYYNLNEVSRKLNVSKYTIKNWFNWSKSKYNKTRLILFDPKRDEKGSIIINPSQLELLKEFKNSLKYGDMAEFNRRYK
ncbi:MAG: hypothetical protein ACOC22_02130 [bacterium]